MTAVNMFCQGGAAYLLTDGALYDLDTGTIVEIRSKVAICKRLKLAVAFSGAAVFKPDRVALALGTCATQSEALQHLPLLASDFKAQIELNYPGEGWSAQMFVATYSDQLRRGKLFLISTAPYGGFPEMELIELDDAVTPGHDRNALMVRNVDLSDPASFDVDRDSVTLLNAQRRIAWPNGCSAVGGFVELTRIGSDDITKRILHRWPDKVGELMPAAV